MVNSLNKAKLNLAVLLFCCTHIASAEMQILYAHNDHLNTPQVLTDASQHAVWVASSQTPFGEVVVDVDPDGDGKTTAFDIRFPGQYFDKETGLNYNYYRTYDPSLGRYIQSDPIGLGDGPNTYSYVHNNPIKYVDPTGEAAAAALCFIPGVGWASCAAVGIAAAGAAGVVGICYLVGACSSGGDDNVVGPGDAWPGNNDTDDSANEDEEECPPEDGDSCEEWLEELLTMSLAIRLGVTEVDDLTKRALNNSIKQFKHSCPHLAKQIGYL